jgi:hypothetical protein
MIAEFFGLDYTVVQEWHDDGLGYGEIAIALFLSQSSGEDAEEIIRLHQEEGLG